MAHFRCFWLNLLQIQMVFAKLLSIQLVSTELNISEFISCVKNFFHSKVIFMQSVDGAKKTLGIVEDKELAELLGKHPSAVSKWRKGGIPAQVERELRKLQMGRVQVSPEPVTPAGEEMSPEKRFLWDLVRSLSDDEAFEEAQRIRQRKKGQESP